MSNLGLKEQALLQLNAIKKSYITNNLQDANEANTRLLIIDQVLQLLGWDLEEFNPESHSAASGYADYLVKLDNIPRFVLEAKKTGVHLVLLKNG